MFSTINEQMFLQLCRIVIKLYNVVPTTSIRKDRRKDSLKIVIMRSFLIEHCIN